jgi:urocanate hydratase
MQHYEDNLKWIREAGKHQLVVGSQARILYSDAVVRAFAFAVPCCQAWL